MPLLTPPLIFLSVEGVLTTQAWFQKQERSRLKNPQVTLADLDPEACRLLQSICTDTGAELVLASDFGTFRHLPEVQAFFSLRGLTATLAGRTPNLEHHADQFEMWPRIKRGLEVQWWLQAFLGDEAACQTRFVCLDYRNGYGDLQGKLVQTRPEVGLTALEGDYVRKHLGETLMDSRAAGGPGRVFFEHDVMEWDPQ